MDIVSKISDLRRIIKNVKSNNKLIGFVPTMGYLHNGHLSLINKTKKHSDFVVISIFVNRPQFNSTCDFETYPRNLERDFDIAENNGVDLVFIPDDKEMYINNLTSVKIKFLTDNLCGARRPGHFDGVFTVVSKLFNLVQPDFAVFGQKDIQQAISIKKMTFDLNFPVEIIISSTVREEDGLAMSSRNKRLDQENRINALVINRSLKECEQMILSGMKDVGIITEKMRQIILEGNPESIDYISAVDYNDLTFIDTIKKKSIVAIAACFNSTRLIDNMIINFDGETINCVY